MQAVCRELIQKEIFMELTKQEFEQILDKKLVNAATKDDIALLANRVDKIEANMVTKTYLVGYMAGFRSELVEELLEKTQQMIGDSQEQLAQIIAETVAIPLQQHIDQCQKVNA